MVVKNFARQVVNIKWDPSDSEELKMTWRPVTAMEDMTIRKRKTLVDAPLRT